MRLKTVVGLAILALFVGTQAWSASSKIHPELAGRLAQAAPGELIPVMIYPPTTADLSIYAPTQKVEMVKRLQDVAAETQADISSYLSRVQQDDREDKAAPRVQDVQSFWVANMVVCKATKEIVQRLADRPDVDRIELEGVATIGAERVKDLPGVNTKQWNITRVRADSVWYQRNIRGTGVVVGDLDTGFRLTQNAFSGRVRPTSRWYDAVTGSANPMDDNGHGTHTMGTIAGGSSNGTDTIGVAVGATIIGAKGLNSAGSGSFGQLASCFQWFATLAGKDSGAVAINNSWGSTNRGDAWAVQIVQNLNNLGSIPIFSNGNSGPGAGTVGSPASMPNTFGVGATTSANPDGIASFSSRGPSASGGWFDSTSIYLDPQWATRGRIKPDLSAPGNSIVSAYYGSDNGTTTMSGTSMAAPHVTGAIALLSQKNWTLTASEIWNYLCLKTARWPTGAGTRPNNNFGWGVLNCLALIDSIPAVAGPNLIYKRATVRDPAPGGNNNGSLDPGETDSLVVYLKNNGVAVATNVTATLRSTSGYVTILDSTGSFGSIAVNAEARQTPAYRVSVSPSVPVGQPIPFVLHTSINSSFWKDLNFTITANLPDTNGTDYYVFGAGDNNSGQRIVNALWTMKYKGKFYPDAKNLVGYPPIAGYRSVWCIVSALAGTDSANFPIKTGSATETQIINYLNAGGRFYMEDVDVGWAADASGGRCMQNLKPYFHYTGSFTGTADYVRGLTGVTGLAYFSAFTGFTVSSADTGTGDFDSLGLGTSATRFFRSTQRPTNNIGMMIGYDSGTYRTLLMDVPIGILQEGAPPMTRSILVDSIMHWFGIRASGVWSEQSPYLPAPTSFAIFGASPNPTREGTSFEYQLPASSQARLVVYNLAGQTVRTLTDGQVPAGYHTARWDGRDASGAKVSAGVYLVRFEAGGYRAVRKAVVVK